MGDLGPREVGLEIEGVVRGQVSKNDLLVGDRSDSGSSDAQHALQPTTAAVAVEPGVMSREHRNTIADVEGPWVHPNFDSGLIERCERGWNTPIGELANEILATYLRQKIALSLVVPEARKRIAAKFADGTELYEDELENALLSATGEG